MGIIAFYYPGSTQAAGAAELFAAALREIYPLPDQDHLLHHHPGGGEAHQGPDGAAGDRLPR